MAEGEARISRADVEHAAQLARLALTDDEVEQLTVDLAKILDHAARVSALDTTNVPPTSHPVELVNVLRPDVPRPCLDRTEVLAEAPVAEDFRFRVPRILGEEP
jgi:aspartyl-tRNA(Asn)/glutamyl-tRNA(Gln) amidotransferase subunit C